MAIRSILPGIRFSTSGLPYLCASEVQQIQRNGIDDVGHFHARPIPEGEASLLSRDGCISFPALENLQARFVKQRIRQRAAASTVISARNLVLRTVM